MIDQLMDNKHHFLTLGDLRKALNNFPDTIEFNSLPLIYSHDDEGSEYQAVNWLPSVVTITEMKSRFIEKVYEQKSKKGGYGGHSIKALIIN